LSIGPGGAPAGQARVGNGDADPALPRELSLRINRLDG
jgi:hypothetical protein